MKYRYVLAILLGLAATSAIAQNAGTGPTGSIPFGRGVGVQGYTWRAPASARSSAGLNIDNFTGHGDSNYSIVATDQIVATNAAFTLARTWTLPAANAVNPGQCVRVFDFQGTVTATNTLSIARAGSDTINGGTSVLINVAYGGYVVCSDGISKWSAQAIGAQVTSLTRNTNTTSALAITSTYCGQYLERSASGSVMSDTLSTSGLSPGCLITIKNVDASAPYEVTVSGGTLDGVSSGFMTLGYRQSGSIQFDGTNFHSILKPTRVLTGPSGYTFYVNPSTGNDNNHGLDSTHAFATRQKCWSYYQQSVDMGGTPFGTSNVCQLADATYTDQFQAVGALAGQDFAAKLTFQGNCTTPANVKINYAGLAWSGDDKAQFAIRCMRNSTSLASSNIILVQHGGTLLVVLDKIEMQGGASTASHFIAQINGEIVFSSNYTIVASGGGTGCSWNATSKGTILLLAPIVIDQSGGSISFGNWACVNDAGLIAATGLTFNGGSTGTRYSATTNGIINTGGGGANYFTGTIAGSTATGGIYE